MSRSQSRAPLALLALAAFGLALVMPAGPAQAFFRNYNEAWCAVMGDGINDCSYYTWQQCRAAASGTGNFCFANPLYVPRAERAPRKKPRYYR